MNPTIDLSIVSSKAWGLKRIALGQSIVQRGFQDLVNFWMNYLETAVIMGLSLAKAE